MYEFKKVDIWSFTKFSAVMGLIIGLFAGLIFAIIGSVFNSAMSAMGGSSIMASFNRPWLGIIIFPLLYGLGGLIGGAISGLLYNLVTKIVGGIKFDITEVETETPKQ